MDFSVGILRFKRINLGYPFNSPLKNTFTNQLSDATSTY